MLKRLFLIILCFSLSMLCSCKPGDVCGPGKIIDCASNCIDESAINSALGDGMCDDNLNCSEFNYDDRDCGDEISTTTTTIDGGTTTTTIDGETSTSTTSITSASVWNTLVGGSKREFANSVELTSDGGYIVVGREETSDVGSYDVLLIKIDENGNTAWSKTFGGDMYDEGFSGHQTSDGGYIIVGKTDSYDDAGIWLIKTDEDGNKIWDKTFGDNFGEGRSVQQTSDGGYIVVGKMNFRDVGLIKTDKDGNKVWEKSFGGEDPDIGRSVQQTTDGGYIIAGSTNSYGAGSTDLWLIKTDTEGNKVWDKTFGGSSVDSGSSVQQTTDGGYIIVGSTYSYGRDAKDLWLIKTDSNGNQAWDKTFGDVGFAEGNSGRQIVDGGYIVVGKTRGDYDLWLIKTDSNGNKVWDKTFDDAEGNFVQQTLDGGYIIAGSTDGYDAGWFDVLLIKTDADGNSDLVSPEGNGICNLKCFSARVESACFENPANCHVSQHYNEQGKVIREDKTCTYANGYEISITFRPLEGLTTAEDSNGDTCSSD